MHPEPVNIMESAETLILVVSVLNLMRETLRECSIETDRGLQCLKHIEPALKIFQDYVQNGVESSSEREQIIRLIASYCLEPMFSKSVGSQLEEAGLKFEPKDQYPRLHAVLSTYKLERTTQALMKALVPFDNREYWDLLINNMKFTVTAIEAGTRDTATAHHTPRIETDIATSSVDRIRGISNFCDSIHRTLNCTCGDSLSDSSESSARLRLDLWGETSPDGTYESVVLVKEKGIWNELLISCSKPSSTDSEAALVSGLLCELLKENDNPRARSQRLRLRLGSQELDHIAMATRHTRTGLGKEITLPDLIDAKQGTEWQVSTKLILAFTIASCVCYLNDGSWTNGGWSSSNILLDGDGFSIHPKPFFDAPRGHVSKTSDEFTFSQAKNTATHRFPDILELARMLIELYLGRRLEYKGGLDLSYHLKATFTRVIEKNPHPGAFLDAIHACLRYFDTATYPSSGVIDVREDMMMKVVQPFEKELQKLQAYREWDQSLPTSMHAKIAAMDELMVEADTQAQTSSRKGSDEWQEQFIYQWMKLETSYGRGKRLPRIKVAVLDSGIAMNHLSFKSVKLRQRIIDHCSWVDDQPHTDNCGHGTHIADTMLRLSSNIDLYIGKITTGDISTIADINDTNAVVKSLRHAREVWEVDMISLSFAFTGSEDDQREIESELRKCWEKRIPVFAAASNDGIDSPRAFPAKSDRALCIHAGFHDGTAHGCNPKAQDRKGNFLVLGCDIRSAWTSVEGGTRYKTGTSFAVPVAISIATFMVAYLEHYATGCQEWFIPPRTAVGVRGMFRVMTEGIRFPDYDWISPCGYLKGKRPEDVVSAMQAILDNSPF